jgi:DeoR family fructose operon transcriptional repressor
MTESGKTIYSVQRQSMILELLEQEGQVEVNSLAKKFSTSRETIRRDLRSMEETGLLTRTHGGAVPLKKKFSQGYEYPLFAREIKKYDEKQRICKGAAKFLEDGDTIFLDNSSTTMNFLRYIPKDIRLTVITNSIQVLLVAGDIQNKNINLVNLGGLLNIKNYSVSGMLSNSFAKSFFPDKAIMSCRGITEKSGMTDASFLEVEVKRIMIDNSKKLIVLADHTKFGLVGAINIGSISEIDSIVTDSKVEREKLKMFEGYKTQIVIVE